jgi:hypothetical protein
MQQVQLRVPMQLVLVLVLFLVLVLVVLLLLLQRVQEPRRIRRECHLGIPGPQLSRVPTARVGPKQRQRERLARAIESIGSSPGENSGDSPGEIPETLPVKFWSTVFRRPTSAITEGRRRRKRKIEYPYV